MKDRPVVSETELLSASTSLIIKLLGEVVCALIAVADKIRRTDSKKVSSLYAPYAYAKIQN